MRRPRERGRSTARAGGAVLVLFIVVLAVPAAAQVSVRSSVGATRLEVGQPVSWVIATSGVGRNDAPEIPPLDWAVVQERGTQQSVSWINGRTSARTVHQYSLTPLREGRFQVPPVIVRVDGRAYSTEPIEVEVLPSPGGLGAMPDAGGSSDPRLRLVASLAPREVVVGEPVVLTMRLYQGVRLLADPGYTPPPTPRFYSEKSGPVHSEYVTAQGARWLLGETRTVLYPTVTGRLTVGPARVLCLLADRDAMGGVEVEITSRPVSVDVRPLPKAPAGHAGAVGDMQLTGSIDRTRVRADEAVEVTFRLSGTGNLRLAPPPTLSDLADFQVFDRRVEDSLEVDRGFPSGTKIVRYALLPRRSGPLSLPPLEYITYVPGQGYRTLSWPGAIIDIAPGLARTTATPAAERAARLVPTRDPGGSPWTAGRPFAGAALVLFAFALWLGRLRLRPRRFVSDDESGEADPLAKARAASAAVGRMAAHRAALKAARARADAATFWRVAEEALAEAGRAGPGETPETAELKARIAAARYAPGGSTAAAMDALAGPLEERLFAGEKQFLAARRTRAPRPARIGSLVLALSGVACLVLGGLAVARHPDDRALARTLATASADLGANHVPEAREKLSAAWNAGARRPGVALDLALAAWYERRLGEAALWTERARRLDPRHPLVFTLIEALREEGAWEGLPVGARARTTGGEIAFVACVLLALALNVFVAFRRHAAARWAGRGLVVAALALAVYAAQSGAAGEAPGRAIVLRPVPLSPAPGVPGDVELEAGRALWIEGRARSGWVPVRLGSQVRGVVPASALVAI